MVCSKSRRLTLYSWKSTNLTIVALSCKTTGEKSELTKSAAMGFFDDIRNVAGGLYYSRKRVAVLWLR